MAKPQDWTREQTLVALNLYCKIPFNRVGSKHPEIVRISKIIGRSPNSLKMKIGNFGSFDPELKRRGIVGLVNASALDREIWKEYSADWARLAYESEKLIAEMTGDPLEKVAQIRVDDLPEGKNRLALVKQRVNQSFFRATVLSSYDNRCCISGLAVPSLLVASHIIPWADDITNRMNPSNGLCLNALHDRAFDQGLIALDHQYRVMLSPKLKDHSEGLAFNDLLRRYEGAEISTPNRFLPSQEFLSHHRETIFQK